jgi:hypothetical protein
LTFYPFPRLNTRPRFFRVILAHFCAFSIFTTFFLSFNRWFYPENSGEAVRRVLVYNKCSFSISKKENVTLTYVLYTFPILLLLVAIVA